MVSPAKLGDRVAANQVIGRIVRSELDDQIRHARDRLAELERRREEISRINSRASSQGRSSASAERRLLEAQLRLAEDKAAAIEKRLVTERDLVAQGLITRRTLLDWRRPMRRRLSKGNNWWIAPHSRPWGIPSRSVSGSGTHRD